MIYRHMAVIDGEMVHFEILDTAGQEEDSLQIEEKIKWGDGFAVVYSVTDRCSFDEVMRLCFLINHIHSSPKRSSGSEQPPVVIVGNKKDLQFDRMVSTEDGENLSKALKLPFYEISTRDSYEETVAVFNTLYQELMRQGHFSPGSFKRRTVSKLMEKIPKMQASSTLNSAGRSLSFNSFRDYIPEDRTAKARKGAGLAASGILPQHRFSPSLPPDEEHCVAVRGECGGRPAV
ncbi:ras-related and estrogen-regulated growth inhibitor isoform X3 [Haliaeetus albicilla]